VGHFCGLERVLVTAVLGSKVGRRAGSTVGVEDGPVVVNRGIRDDEGAWVNRGVNVLEGTMGIIFEVVEVGGIGVDLP
jgi:hypothetical protein